MFAAWIKKRLTSFHRVEIISVLIETVLAIRAVQICVCHDVPQNKNRRHLRRLPVIKPTALTQRPFCYQRESVPSELHSRDPD
jgi:hypothetical protein